MIFKYAEYEKFLRYAKEMGDFVPLGEWRHSKSIILRHDVDFDVEAAYRLALVEAECEVRSTYCFLMTCQNYNPLSAINRSRLFEMSQLGFEIGLHFDPAIYGTVSAAELKAYADQEAESLASLTGKPVRSLSLHNPALNGQYPIIDGYCNAYSRKIFSDDCYLSDSRMDFRGKDPYQFILKVKEHAIQILLHPLHYSEKGDAYPDYFFRRFKSDIDTIDEEFRLNSTYSRLMSTDLFDYVITKARNR